MKKIQKKVFITRSSFPYGQELIKNSGLELVFHHGPAPITTEEIKEALKNFDYIISMLTDPFNKEVFEVKTKTRLIAQFAVGYNNIDLVAAKAQNIVVTNTPNVLSFSSAETAFMLMQAISRKLIPLEKTVKNNTFKGFDPYLNLGKDLRHKTLGIIGLGRIGQQLASFAKAFYDMKIVYYSRTSKDLPYTRLDLEELLKVSDVVSIHTDLNHSSKNLLNLEALSMMKDDAILINTSRGEVIDQAALLSLLLKGKFYGVGLDVTTPEPLEKDHPLKGFDRVLITPHIGSSTDQTRSDMGELCLLNILEFEKNNRALTAIRI